MSLPGPNHTHTTARRARVLPYERFSIDRPAPLRTMAQAMVAGLRVDAESRGAGYRDGAAGNRWDPGEHDVFSYASGYVFGKQFGRQRDPENSVVAFERDRTDHEAGD